MQASETTEIGYALAFGSVLLFAAVFGNHIFKIFFFGLNISSIFMNKQFSSFMVLNAYRLLPLGIIISFIWFWQE